MDLNVKKGGEKKKGDLWRSIIILLRGRFLILS